MAPAPWRVALAVAAAALRPARADECAGDFVVVLDRSNSIGNKWWNHRNDGEGVIDFLESLVDALDPCDGADAGCAATTRVAMVVFPAYDGGDYEDDWSGGAKIVQGLTTDPDVYTGSNGILTNVGTGKNACDSDPNDGSADSVMSWPCGGWAWTPTWLGLEAAYDELFVNSYDPSSIKTVILVTDGLPSNNAAVGSKFERPVHLTLEAATKLKDKIATESASGRVFGVGVGGNYEDIGTSPCEPFCDHYKGEGLFMGNYAYGTTYSGEVTIEGFDGSDAYCGSAPSCYPECTESQHNAASNKEGCGTYTASETHDSLVTGDTVSEKYENIVSLSSSADLIDNVDVIMATVTNTADGSTVDGSTLDNDGSHTIVVPGSVEVSTYDITLACSDGTCADAEATFDVSYTFPPSPEPTTALPYGPAGRMPNISQDGGAIDIHLN